jgi:hypothetical protein
MSIRSRILDFLDFKGLSRYRFYKMTDLSNGFLDKEGAINSDNCEKICDVFPEMNPEWLVLGKGEMLRGPKPATGNEQELQVPVAREDKPNPLAVEVLLDKIVELTTEIAHLKMENKDLKKRRKIHLPPTEDDVRDSIAASPGVE